jgi:hypothetical protein
VLQRRLAHPVLAHLSINHMERSWIN